MEVLSRLAAIGIIILLFIFLFCCCLLATGILGNSDDDAFVVLGIILFALVFWFLSWLFTGHANTFFELLFEMIGKGFKGTLF